MNAEVGTSAQRVGNELKAAQDEVFRRVAPALKSLADGAVDVAQEYPMATAAVTALAGAATLAAAALGAAGLAGMIRPGGAAPIPGGAAPAGAPGRAPVGPAAGAAGAAAAGGRALITRLGVGGAAVYAGSQLGRLWDALQQAEQAKQQAFEAQGGSFLSLDSRIRLDRQRMPLPPGPGLPGQPDLLGVPGMGGGLALGQGKLDVAVRVTDDRVTATTQVTQPMSLVKINPGNTNPGSYR